MTKPLLTKQRRKTLSGSKSNIYNKVITIDVFWAEEPELKRQELSSKRQWAKPRQELLTLLMCRVSELIAVAS